MPRPAFAGGIMRGGRMASLDHEAMFGPLIGSVDD